MLRQLGKARATFRPMGRRRISNQLAAFAAIMLFASTQVPSPDSANATAVTGNPQGQQIAVELDDGNLSGHEQGLDTSALNVSATTGGQDKSRSLNFSLFLLRL